MPFEPHSPAEVTAGSGQRTRLLRQPLLISAPQISVFLEYELCRERLPDPSNRKAKIQQNGKNTDSPAKNAEAGSQKRQGRHAMDQT